MSSARRAATYAPRDRGAACAAVGLEDVAVEPERPLAERLEVDDGAERAADQALDLDRAALLLAARRLALHAVAGRGRQERVLRRHPAAALAAQASAGCPLRRMAVQSTFVRPAVMTTEPCGFSRKSTSNDELAKLVGSASVSLVTQPLLPMWPR